MTFGRSDSEDAPRIELTPLIDVIFQLLLFFMVTTTFAAGPDKPGLDVDLPTSGAPKRVTQPSDVIVVLTADGQILVGKKIVAQADLGRILSQAREQDPNRKMVLQADKRALHEDVVGILDAARVAGMRVAIATDIHQRS